MPITIHQNKYICKHYQAYICKWLGIKEQKKQETNKNK